MRVMITGWRGRTIRDGRKTFYGILTAAQKEVIHEALAANLSTSRGGIESVVIVHGRADGVDSVAALWADMMEISTEVFPADWKTHGREAGPIRNQEMVDTLDPETDLVLAFPHPESRGTWDAVRKAKAAGVPVRIYHLEEAET